VTHLGILGDWPVWAGRDPDRLRARADAVLYIAKKLGHRVCSNLHLQEPETAQVL
jgi:hypothetical protein